MTIQFPNPPTNDTGEVIADQNLDEEIAREAMEKAIRDYFILRLRHLGFEYDADKVDEMSSGAMDAANRAKSFVRTDLIRVLRGIEIRA